MARAKVAVRVTKAVAGSRRRERTRDAIIEAGETLFATRPIEGVTIDQIVEVAEVAKGSFYNHFTDKEELAAAIIELVQGDCEFHIFRANRSIPDCAVRVTRALCVMLRYALDHPERLQALLSLGGRSTSPESPLNAGVAGDVREGIDNGRFIGVALETGMLAVIGLIRITVTHAMSPAPLRPIEEIAASMGEVMLRALGVPEAECAEIAMSATAILAQPSARRR